MEIENVRIVRAKREDAEDIAAAVVAAFGEELTRYIAGDKDTSAVLTLFTELAAREDSQHSYANTLKALDSEGNAMGYIVAYDGSRLYALRKTLIEMAKSELGRELRNIGDETDAGEYYIDSLAVFPKYRGRGVATALINGMYERAREVGKPLGLLCEKTNQHAQKLYKSLGFKYIGETEFAGAVLNHFQLY